MVSTIPSHSSLPSTQERLTPQDWQKALGMLNACNASGLLSWLGSESLRSKIWAEVDSTEAFNQHPIVVLLTSQLMQLAGFGIADIGVFGKAYEIAKERAKS